MKFISKKTHAIPASLSNMLGILGISAIFGFMQFGLPIFAYADSELSLSDNIKKITLIQEAVAQPDSLNGWTKTDIEILLSQPKIKRDEQVVQAWHYHGESCALDIYFDAMGNKPDHVEFRPLSLNNDVHAQFEATDANTMKSYCLKDVLEAQGVDTPSSYARQPLPSWENPYRT